MALTWDDIKDEFIQAITSDPVLKRIYKQSKAGGISFADANTYSIKAGDILGNVLANHQPESLTEWDIENLIPQSLGMDNGFVSEIAMAAIEHRNTLDNIGIKAQKADFNSDKAYSLVDELNKADDYKSIEPLMKASITNFSQSIIDDTIRKNAEFQTKSGVDCFVVRRAEHGACKWCQAQSGSFKYEDVSNKGNDVWRRHENCHCDIEFRHDGISETINNFKKITPKAAKTDE